LAEYQSMTRDVCRPAAQSRTEWFALWVRSHCEHVVCDQLKARGFETFLPMIKTWSRQAGMRRALALPMFPGYLFLRHAMDKSSYVEVVKTRGLVRILGERWDRLAPVPDGEIEAIARVVSTDIPLLPHPYLREGHRVRITEGPLAGVEGILVHAKPAKGLLVVSIDLLQRSVAVEVDCTRVVSAGQPPAAPAQALPCGGAAVRYA
jgi:transcription termination/antitermination protein NusG